MHTAVSAAENMIVCHLHIILKYKSNPPLTRWSNEYFTSSENNKHPRSTKSRVWNWRIVYPHTIISPLIPHLSQKRIPCSSIELHNRWTNNAEFCHTDKHMVRKTVERFTSLSKHCQAVAATELVLVFTQICLIQHMQPQGMGMSF